MGESGVNRESGSSGGSLGAAEQHRTSAADGLDPAPDQFVMIIGAMKAGTSALFDLLCQHPSVCGSRVKEPEYFSVGQGHGLKVGRYADLWDFDSTRHVVALEASTGYSKYPDELGVPGRIAAHGLQPRFLYVLRDPIERIASHVSYAAWGKKGAVADFRAANVVNASRYAMQLDQYAAEFPRDRILLVDHAGLLADPAGACRATFDFLGLPALDVKAPAQAKNAARPRSKWERRLMRSGRLARMANAAPGPVKSSLRGLSGARTAPRPNMDPDTAAWLRAELAEDMVRLRDEWGFDVAPWGF